MTLPRLVEGSRKVSEEGVFGTDFMWCFLELCTPSEKMTFHAQEY